MVTFFLTSLSSPQESAANSSTVSLAEYPAAHLKSALFTQSLPLIISPPRAFKSAYFSLFVAVNGRTRRLVFYGGTGAVHKIIPQLVQVRYYLSITLKYALKRHKKECFSALFLIEQFFGTRFGTVVDSIFFLQHYLIMGICLLLLIVIASFFQLF